MSVVLGIDLGTTNSVVCVSQGGNLPQVLPDPDGNPLIPSVVSFHPAGDVLVGHPARERRLLDAKNTIYSVKRLIGRPFRSPEVRRAQERFPFELCEGPTQGVLVKARGETYTLPEISAFVLREVRRIAEDRMGVACTQAVITVPANFNELQRSATKAAGRVAGLEVLRILNEPTAAALAYGYGKGSRERIAVFDLGGGTFDITILELAGDVFEVLSTAGDTFLGGDDIDVLIADKMADAFLQHHRFDARTDDQAYERLRAAAEWAKCQLSDEPEVQLRVEELAYGESGASLDLTFGMTRSALEHLARPLIARAFDVCEDAMGVAGVRPSQLDNVILVGGSTRMPLVQGMVAEYFGKQPLSTIDPDLVVAQGASLQGAALAPRSDLSGPKRLAKVALKKVSRVDLQKMKDRRAQLRAEAAAQMPAQPAFQPARAPVPMWEEIDEQPTRIAPGADGATQPNAPAHQDATAVGTATQEETRVVGAMLDQLDASDAYDPSMPQQTAAKGESYDDIVRQSGSHSAEEIRVALKKAGAQPPAAPPAPPPEIRVALKKGGAPPPPPPSPEIRVALKKGAPPPPPEPPEIRVALKKAGPDEELEPEVTQPRARSLPDPEEADEAIRVALRKRRRPDMAPQGGDTLGFGSGGMAVPDFDDLETGPVEPHHVADAITTPSAAPAEPEPPPPVTSTWQPAEAPPEPTPQEKIAFEAPVAPPPQAPPAAPPQQARAPQPPAQPPAQPAPPQPPPVGSPSVGSPSFPAPQMMRSPASPPLLLDVTPHTFGVETVGGYCEGVIKRNAAIPVEQTRLFVTGADDQDSVSVRIFQGESRRLSENQPLGEIQLTGLRRAARGEVQIEVTFIMDADGTLGVVAVDKETGQQQIVRVKLVGGVDDDEIRRMQERQARMMGA